MKEQPRGNAGPAGASLSSLIMMVPVSIVPWRAGMVVAAIVCAYASLATQTKIVGYYHAPTSALPVSSVRFDLLTHLNHAFAYPDPQGNVIADPDVPNPDLIEKAHGNGCKILISLGGASTSSSFPELVTSSALRAAFVRNVVQFIKIHGYDGADLDWEGPENNEQKSGLNTLVQEMRQAFDAENPEWLLTMAVGSLDWTGQWYDYTTLSRYVDWFNVMAYEFHGSWSDHTGHNAPLFPPSTAVCDDGSVLESIDYHLHERGTLPGKIVLGLPFYGYRFHTSVSPGLYKPKTNAVRVPYKEIAVQKASFAPVWDAISEVPFLARADESSIICYDDSLSIARKCAFAKQRGLGGIMIWALGQDALSAERQPLLATVAREMGETPTIVKRNEPPVTLALDVYPNPSFAGTEGARVAFSLPRSGRATIRVYNIIGKLVATITDSEWDGSMDHHLPFDVSGFSSGFYVVQMEFDGRVLTKGIVVLK